jgi:hypothetical protein
MSSLAIPKGVTTIEVKFNQQKKKLCFTPRAFTFSIFLLSQHHLHRYRDNRHVSMGAEKWLDIELWNSIHDCFQVLKSRGYRIATTHVGMDAVLLSSFPFPALFPNQNPAFTPSFPFPALCLLRSPFTTWIGHNQLQ